MIDIISLNQFFICFVAIACLTLGFWVYLSNKKSNINRLFLLITIFILGWTIFSYLADTTIDPYKSLIYRKLVFGTSSLFYVISYFFAIYFPKKNTNYPILDKIVLFLGITFSFLSVSTNLIVKNIKIEEWGSNIIKGIGMDFYLITTIILTSLVIFILYKKYFNLSDKEKLKTQYFLIGATIFASINLIFSVFPLIFHETYKYHQIGDYSAIFLLGFTAYAIVKKDLFGMKTILTSILVGSITILLLLDTLLFTENFSIQILKGVSLFIFLIFGYYLIKSVKEEVQRRKDAEILSRAKSEFISMASHQLRTPLTVIKGYIAMILDGSYGKIDSKAIKVLGNVSISTERLVKIIEDLLNISRIQLGKMDLEKEPTDIKKMIDNICQEIKIKAEEKNLKIIWEKPKTILPKLRIDPLKIRQVIYNIVDNAIKYTEKGKIKIELSRKNSNLIISISDTGRGFDENDGNKLFELFSRGKAGTDTFVQGTGMGLYVAKKFVSLHKGKIWADSKGKNKGSSFYIELPIK